MYLRCQQNYIHGRLKGVDFFERCFFEKLFLENRAQGILIT